MDVFLSTADGRNATYEKTGDYVVEGEALGSYFEGVTTSGNACGFSTELGVIVETIREHGFYLSHIDLGSVFEVGTRFRNVYRVYLRDSFTAEEEHWTQEIAWPTKHLTLHIRFPAGRRPKLKLAQNVSDARAAAVGTVAAVSWPFANCPQPLDLFDLRTWTLGNFGPSTRHSPSRVPVLSSMHTRMKDIEDILPPSRLEAYSLRHSPHKGERQALRCTCGAINFNLIKK